MRIHLAPLNIEGAAFLDTNDIFISTYSRNMYDTLVHELAHIYSGERDHSPKWYNTYTNLGGKDYDNIDLNVGNIDVAFNIGNITGMQNLLVDYHLLQAYRKFSQTVLGTIGHWEVINEVDGDSSQQVIRLYPTPKGAFPVVVLYIPTINQFRSPQARQLAYDLMVAECKIMVGMARRKIAGMPTPEGSAIQYDGADMVQEGEKAKEDIIQKAINLGEPLGVWMA